MKLAMALRYFRPRAVAYRSAAIERVTFTTQMAPSFMTETNYLVSELSFTRLFPLRNLELSIRSNDFAGASLSIFECI